MRISSSALVNAAAESGFNSEPLEKVFRLLDLLERIQGHPFLKGRLVLKGGTALNLFHLAVPRLSVDIDLNYIGGIDRQTMLEERPKVEQAIAAVCGRADLNVRRAPTEHAGGKWRLRYADVNGRQGNLELDLNFLMRAPLWPPQSLDSQLLGPFGVQSVLVSDVHELAAGKLAALFSRTAARDLYDVCRFLEQGTLNPQKLRLAFVVYGGISRRDWRSVAIGDISVAESAVQQQLIPMLRRDLAPPPGETGRWTERLVSNCQRLCSDLLPFTEGEVQFLEALNSRGEIIPELLTDDEGLRQQIRVQPGLLWKAHNVRQHQQGASPGN